MGSMNPAYISVIISLVGMIVSITVSAFISGAWKGRIETTMGDMSRRLANIEGMFKLTLKD